MSLSRFHRNSRGFTLIELLIVLVIIGILLSIGLAAFRRAQVGARDGQRKTHVETIAGALEQYYADNDRYPAQATVQTDLEGGNYLRDWPTPPTGTTSYDYFVSGNSQQFCVTTQLEIAPSSSLNCPVNGISYPFLVSSSD